MSDTLTSTNPLYRLYLPMWSKLRDCYEGEDFIKNKGEIYLKPTGAHRIDGYPRKESDGYKDYSNYLMRAVFHGYIEESVQAALGKISKRPAKFELPKQLEFLLENATLLGESLEDLLYKINFEQLLPGRVGLLGDVDSKTNNPYLSIYRAESIVDWDDSDLGQQKSDLSYISIDESGYYRSVEGGWEYKNQYRFLKLVNGVYSFVISEDENPDDSLYTPFSVMGKTSADIPFCFANSMDISNEPSKPPLLDLANLSLAIYRGEADYRYTLYLQSQATLVTINLQNRTIGKDKSVRTGAGAVLDINQGGDAKYIAAPSSGLAEQRQALENDKSRARAKTSSSFSEAGAGESGEALKLRSSAKTASLTSIVKSGAACLERVLRIMADYYGANPDKVKVIPNLEFDDVETDPTKVQVLMSAKTSGAPISLKTVHEVCQKTGLTTKTYDEEIKELLEEGEIITQLNGFMLDVKDDDENENDDTKTQDDQVNENGGNQNSQ